MYMHRFIINTNEVSLAAPKGGRSILRLHSETSLNPLGEQDGEQNE